MQIRSFLLKFIVVLNFIFFLSCESTEYNQSEKLTYDQSIKTENKINSLQGEKGNNTLVKNDVISKDSEKLVIGLMLPLTGEHYRIGTTLLNAAQLALEKTNENNISFKVIDTGNDDKWIENFYKLTNQNIELIIGPVFSEKVKKIQNIIEERKIHLITFSNNSLLEKTNLFVYGVTLEDEIKTLLDYSNTKNLKSFSVILPENEYGKKIKFEIEKYSINQNKMNFNYQFYNPNNPDFYNISKTVSDYEERKLQLEEKIIELESKNNEESKNELKKLKKLDTLGELDFEAIMILTQSFNELSKLSSILPYYDIDPKNIQYIGNSVWNNDLSLKEPGLNGGYFTSMNINKIKSFEEEYIQYFGHKPHKLGTLSYDLVGLIARLYKEKNQYFINDLYSKSGFIGINGWFRFETDGKVRRKLNIYKILNKKFVMK